MGKVPKELREIIARNIRECRKMKYPGRGGGKRCAAEFGVSPQQWSPWERGMRTPDETRLLKIAKHFGVSVEYLRRDNRSEAERLVGRPAESDSPNGLRGCPFYSQPVAGDATGHADGVCRLAEHILGELARNGLRIRFAPEDFEELFQHFLGRRDA